MNKLYKIWNNFDFITKAGLCTFAIYGLVYLTICTVETLFGVII